VEAICNINQKLLDQIIINIVYLTLNCDE